MLDANKCGNALIRTDLPLGQAHRGKVRDCYSLGDRMILVSTDRISAFDWVLPTPIPDKGRVLTSISEFWFRWLSSDSAFALEHHLLSTDVESMGLPEGIDLAALRGRTMLVRRAEVIPFECVVRDRLAGSGLNEYRSSGTVCGIRLPSGLGPGSKLPEPIFTPATKAESGHDENVSFAVMADVIGTDLAERLREKSLAVYRRGAKHAAEVGIVVADTKFEWGLDSDGRLILVDEVLTPDSSRFWPAQNLELGKVPDSFDKQFVRDWLEKSGWDKQSPPPNLPADIVEGTRQKYFEACLRLTGKIPHGV
ncbi:MAG: phosphoribosylaminoimidazolesuccinocarboxamide synthase [Planctomycetota bacterium]|nr:MAG: phosphoribosylaminoimidazolesuccinocarboxamide synthase [Planctomycetaceae bacterium]